MIGDVSGDAGADGDGDADRDVSGDWDAGAGASQSYVLVPSPSLGSIADPPIPPPPLVTPPWRFDSAPFTVKLNSSFFSVANTKKKPCKAFPPVNQLSAGSIAVAGVATLAMSPDCGIMLGVQLQPPQQSLWHSEVNSYQLFCTERFAF